jgi:hypothetical protein
MNAIQKMSESPVRQEIKSEIIAALANSTEPMTAAQLAACCNSSPDTTEIARVCYELRTKKGAIELAEDYQAPGCKPVKTYRLAKHPWKQPAVQKTEKPARITRDLPSHLQSKPQADLDQELIQVLKEAIEEEVMTEDNADYQTQTDAMAEIRVMMVDSLLIYANLALRDDPVWRAMLRPYKIASGADNLESIHG